jgi:superfamily II DNA or RNA helicase
MGRRIRLRPYQKSAVQEVVSRYTRENARRLLLYLPTGAGKTVIAAFIIKELLTRPGFGKVLFVAHRREILDQTARTIAAELPRARLQIEQGGRHAHRDATITIASVQSLVRRKERFDPKAFSLIICDECHRALAPSWGEVIDYFHAHRGRDTLLLGMTATPRRTDGRSALDLFDEVAFEIGRTDLEDLGFLVPMSYYMVRSDLRLDKVKISGGDFQVGGLSRVMSSPVLRALTIRAWLEKGLGKRTIAFCAGVDHARRLAEDFEAQGVKAREIDGRTKDRNLLLRSFAEGEFDVLTNYGVLTEGFDDPGVACILMARPTTSPLVYTQCLGRGLRTAPGKAACTVIDIVDRSTHQLQYGANEMAGLPPKWRTRGGDPFREAQSLAGIKVTSKEAFLSIRNAGSLEEVQSILMSLPPESVVAGLDGEPVLRYEPPTEPCSSEQALKAARALLRQAKARIKKLVVEEERVRIRFRAPETDNERYAFLKWHLARATGRTVLFETAPRRRRTSNPRTLLKSMIPAGCRIGDFDADPEQNTVHATITGLTPEETETIAEDFHAEFGMTLNLKGQLSLF